MQFRVSQGFTIHLYWVIYEWYFNYYISIGIASAKQSRRKKKNDHLCNCTINPMYEYLFPFISLAVGSSRTKRSTFQAPLIVHPDAVVSLEAHVRPGARAYLGDIAGAVTCWSSSFFVPPTAANYASFTYPKLPGSSLSWDHEWVKDIGTCFQYILRHALPRHESVCTLFPIIHRLPSFSFLFPYCVIPRLGNFLLSLPLHVFVYFKDRFFVGKVVLPVVCL